MKTHKVLCLLILVIATSCHDEDKRAPDAEAVKYINEVVGLLEKWSIDRKSVDWSEFRRDIVSRVMTSDDINKTIRYALTKLNDPHSFIFRNNEYIHSDVIFDCSAVPATYTPNDKIGYIRIQTYNGSDNSFAEIIQEEIEKQDSEDLVGWIVDLRGNLGGNMWPMIAGVGPILGEGVCGYFIDPDGGEQKWEYTNGTSINGGINANTVADPYTLINSNPKVAVLIDQATASSGECVSIAFQGRANTRSFGTATCGLTTANAGFPLSDGNVFYIATSYEANRDKTKVIGPVTPDEVLSGNAATVSRAIEWLREAD